MQSATGGRVRENNEDNYLLGNCLNAESLDESETHFTQRAGLWTCAGVFDGMGGELEARLHQT